MKYAIIKYNDISNGFGVRTSLFVSGCEHYCKGCFNEEAWDFCYGKEFDEKVIEEILLSIEATYIKGLSLLGGEPLHPKNQKDVALLVKRFREKYEDKKDIWCYTGYIYEKDFLKGERAYTEYTEYLLNNIDILVDGPFVAELYDISLKFRGSSNQNIINLKTKEILKI